MLVMGRRILVRLGCSCVLRRERKRGRAGNHGPGQERGERCMRRPRLLIRTTARRAGGTGKHAVARGLDQGLPTSIACGERAGLLLPPPPAVCMGRNTRHHHDRDEGDDERDNHNFDHGTTAPAAGARRVMARSCALLRITGTAIVCLRARICARHHGLGMVYASIKRSAATTPAPHAGRWRAIAWRTGDARGGGLARLPGGGGAVLPSRPAIHGGGRITT